MYLHETQGVKKLLEDLHAGNMPTYTQIKGLSKSFALKSRQETLEKYIAELGRALETGGPLPEKLQSLALYEQSVTLDNLVEDELAPDPLQSLDSLREPRDLN